MKQSLQLKLGQQLTMTPQLQQAIRLLQLSTMDLQQEIQQALDSNPMLEVPEEDNEPEDRSIERDDGVGNKESTTSDGPMDSLEGTASQQPADDTEWSAGLPEDLPVDTQWDDLIPAASASVYSGDDLSDTGFDSGNASNGSLREDLLWQLNLTRLSDIDRLIALAIIDATDDNGRVVQELEDIHQSLSPEVDVEIDLDEIVAVLHRLQQFEPAATSTNWATVTLPKFYGAPVSRRLTSNRSSR